MTDVEKIDRPEMIEVRVFGHALDAVPFETLTMRLDQLEDWAERRGTPLVLEINAL